MKNHARRQALQDVMAKVDSTQEDLQQLARKVASWSREAASLSQGLKEEAMLLELSRQAERLAVSEAQYLDLQKQDRVFRLSRENSMLRDELRDMVRVCRLLLDHKHYDDRGYQPAAVPVEENEEFSDPDPVPTRHVRSRSHGRGRTDRIRAWRASAAAAPAAQPAPALEPLGYGQHAADPPGQWAADPAGQQRQVHFVETPTPEADGARRGHIARASYARPVPSSPDDSGPRLEPAALRQSGEGRRYGDGATDMLYFGHGARQLADRVVDQDPGTEGLTEENARIIVAADSAQAEVDADPRVSAVAVPAAAQEAAYVREVAEQAARFRHQMEYDKQQLGAALAAVDQAMAELTLRFPAGDGAAAAPVPMRTASGGGRATTAVSEPPSRSTGDSFAGFVHSERGPGEVTPALPQAWRLRQQQDPQQHQHQEAEEVAWQRQMRQQQLQQLQQQQLQQQQQEVEEVMRQEAQQQQKREAEAKALRRQARKRQEAEEAALRQRLQQQKEAEEAALRRLQQQHEAEAALRRQAQEQQQREAEEEALRRQAQKRQEAEEAAQRRRLQRQQQREAEEAARRRQAQQAQEAEEAALHRRLQQQQQREAKEAALRRQAQQVQDAEEAALRQRLHQQQQAAEAEAEWRLQQQQAAAAEAAAHWRRLQQGADQLDAALAAAEAEAEAAADAADAADAAKLEAGAGVQRAEAAFGSPGLVKIAAGGSPAPAPPTPNYQGGSNAPYRSMPYGSDSYPSIINAAGFSAPAEPPTIRRSVAVPMVGLAEHADPTTASYGSHGPHDPQIGQRAVSGGGSADAGHVQPAGLPLDAVLMTEVEKLRRVNRTLASTLNSYNRVTDRLSDVSGGLTADAAAGALGAKAAGTPAAAAAPQVPVAMRALFSGSSTAAAALETKPYAAAAAPPYAAYGPWLSTGSTAATYGTSSVNSSAAYPRMPVISAAASALPAPATPQLQRQTPQALQRSEVVLESPGVAGEEPQPSAHGRSASRGRYHAGASTGGGPNVLGEVQRLDSALDDQLYGIRRQLQALRHEMVEDRLAALAASAAGGTAAAAAAAVAGLPSFTGGAAGAMSSPSPAPAPAEAAGGAAIGGGGAATGLARVQAEIAELRRQVEADKQWYHDSLGNVVLERSAMFQDLQRRLDRLLAWST